MHPNALLELATDLLHRVMQFDSAADGVVRAFFREHRALGPRERHTLADTTYEVLRKRLLFEHLARSGKGETVRRLALLGWQGNAGFLRGALDVQEQQWLARCQAVDPAALSDPLRHNLPGWLAASLQARLGEEFWALVESLSQPAPLDLRVNLLKAKRDEVASQLAASGTPVLATPFSPWGLRIAGRPSLNQLDVFVRGEVEIQEEGSQLLAILVGAKRGEMIVDFCAGAGGKTLALGAAMRNTGRLYAFDTSGHRLAALTPRLARSGLSNVYPVQLANERDDRVKRLAGKIDRVLVDAPCSGLGTLRRNPDLKWRQTPEAVAGFQSAQTAILGSARRLVKPGGRLVYATCSLLDEENEAVVESFTAAHGSDFELLPVAALLTQAGVAEAPTLVEGGMLRLWPHRHGTDGFFAAAWQRHR